MACQEQEPCPLNPVFYIYLLNMDTQDGQDNEDETLRHRKRARSMIGLGLCSRCSMSLEAGFRILVETWAIVELKTVVTFAQ